MDQEVDYNKKKDQIANGLLWILTVCIICVALIGWRVADKLNFMLPEKINDWGVIGDFVGGLSNPLISAFTFFALLLTIIQNQKIIGINEQELKETRKEIELTREANEKQAKEFSLQNDITRNRAEVQTTTEALLKTTDLVNNVWKGPTTYAVQRAEPDGKVVRNYLSLSECTDPWWDFGTDFDLLKEVESTISEIVQLLMLHKSLLLKLESISPNSSMVIAISLLVKVPVQWLGDNKAFEEVLGDLEGAALIGFYNKHWEFKEIASN